MNSKLLSIVSALLLLVPAAVSAQQSASRGWGVKSPTTNAGGRKAGRDDRHVTT